MTITNTASIFLEFSRWKLLEQYWLRLRECVASLTDEQVWWRPNDQSNSAANILLQLQRASAGLTAMYGIQGYKVNGFDIVYDVVEHRAASSGQPLSLFWQN